MLSVSQALVYILVMGLAIFLCRVFPFLLFWLWREGGSSPKTQVFFAFIEKAAPPAAMTVLAVHALLGPLRENLSLSEAAPAIIAAAAAAFLTVVLRLLNGNALLCIGGGTALYMVLVRIL